jgi:hypothetical protein
LSPFDRKRLLFLAGRASFVAIKPATLLLAGLFLPVQNSSILAVLLTYIPLSTAFASIPVHRDLYKTALSRSAAVIGDDDKDYYGAVVIMGGTLFVVATLLLWLALNFGLTGALAVAALFLLDKLLDELMRWQQYRRNIPLWFYYGIVRNGWLPVYLALAYFTTIPFAIAIGISSLVVALGCAATAGKFIGNLRGIHFGRSGRLVTGGIQFYIGSFFDAFLRNTDKILINLFVPHIAAFLVSFSMLMQGAYLLNEATFILPKRRMIAKRPSGFLLVVISLVDGHAARFTAVGLITAGCLATIAMAMGVTYANFALLATLSIATTLLGVMGGNLQEGMFWLVDGRSFLLFHLKAALLVAAIIAGAAALGEFTTFIASQLAPVIPYIGSFVTAGAYFVWVRWFLVRKLAQRRSNQRLKSTAEAVELGATL